MSDQEIKSIFMTFEDTLDIARAELKEIDISAEEIEKRANDSWKRGQEEARRTFDKDSGSDVIAKMISDLGITIDIRDMDSVRGDKRYYAEFYDKVKSIVIFKTAVEKFAVKYGIDYETAYCYILVHELYHYKEKMAGYKDDFTVLLFKIGKAGFGKKNINIFSEIAAYAFSEEWNIIRKENNHVRE